MCSWFPTASNKVEKICVPSSLLSLRANSVMFNVIILYIINLVLLSSIQSNITNYKLRGYKTNLKHNYLEKINI